MRKLIIALLFAAFLPHAVFAVAGPSQWSLAGVASWAQPLTASGTALPATATYEIGDLFALYGGAASTTFELYRLSASGTTGVWRSTAGGGISEVAILAATDLPAVAGNENKHLALGTDTTSLYWSTPPGTAANVTAHLAATNSPHGNVMNIGYHYFLQYSGQKAQIYRKNPAVTLENGNIVVGSFTSSIFVSDTYAILAPASSTQFIGIYSEDLDYTTYTVFPTIQASGTLIITSGEMDVLIADDSASIAPGDWVITSDTQPGYAMRAAVAGDVPLSLEESQRKLGIALNAQYTAMGATYTWIIMKGAK